MNKINLYQIKCSLCGKKFQSASEVLCRNKLINHIDNDCKVASLLRECGKQGIYKDFIEILTYEVLEKDLEKLINKYGLEKVKEVLKDIETIEEEK